MALASEFKRQQLEGDSGGASFASGLTRHVLFAIHDTVREENARAGLDYLKTDDAFDYRRKRKAILALLACFKPLAHVNVVLGRGRRCYRTHGRRGGD